MSNPYMPPNNGVRGHSALPNRHRSPEALSRDYMFQQNQHYRQHQNPRPAPAVPAHGSEQHPSPYHRSVTHVNRSKSLSRPERQRPRTGMINRKPSTRHQQAKIIIDNRRTSQNVPSHRNTYHSNQPMSPNLQLQLQQQKQQQQQQMNEPVNLPANDIEEEKEEPNVLTSWWAWIAFLSTCCFPNYIIRVWFGKTNKNMQQAWREKLTLCYLVGLLCGLLAYIIYGLHIDLCPTDRTNLPYAINIDDQRVPVQRDHVYVFGQVYPFNTTRAYFGSQNLDLSDDFKGLEIGSIFEGDTKTACAAYESLLSSTCSVISPTGITLSKSDGSCLSVTELHQWSNSEGFLSFDWVDIRSSLNDMQASNIGLIVDSIVNMTSYFQNNQSIFGAEVDKVLRATRGNDMTYALLSTSGGKEAKACIVSKYGVGIVNQEAGGCIADQLIMTVMFAVIIIIIIIRYSMACLFQWFIARRLTKPGGRSNWLAWRSIKGGNDDPANHIPGPYNDYGQMAQNSVPSLHSNNDRSLQGSNHGLSGNRTDVVETELYTVMLVTCYSEGEEGLKITMDSLSNTTYSNKHKIFFVIADGLITGAGETMSTPDIVVNMMDLTPAMANPKPVSYLAVADGEKQLNMAKVYAGHYNGTACVTIVKCGTEEEQKGAKAGNRGKRDSQVILMSFFQRVLFNDRFCELDYEIFWKMTWLMDGVTPDKFETVLMVDADTEVLPDALSYMIAAMANDITIMGLCGETRIANKRTSWVTAIQVFEYYISHHYAKAFESLFGMVTCLPGCFSMYRIKSPKNGSWVPILANPDIILEYNENVVTTLHEKNLLLLGEDRFLSTLMLRTFPKRQMMFVPQARCRTVVPDEFSVLLSQRRRWINSTVHNLMELVLVSDLCGIACLSMQFSVFIDLIGTLVLPAAIVMTVYLIIVTAITPNPQWQSIGLLIAILVLPAFLIAITTLKIVYIGWMIIYIIALPVWNLILPLYSYWHFDDFSWGATRVVVGEKKGESHGDKEGKFDSKRLVMKKWEDWEAERTGQYNGRKIHLKSPQNSFVSYSNTAKASSSPFYYKKF